ncbi:protein jag [Angustibacter sp. McL0619]|uniref:Jag family protein n=1 Tax=Angustibacter sp. McL0619 TaxID=3415676 RepID=UPI003CE76D43
MTEQNSTATPVAEDVDTGDTINTIDTVDALETVEAIATDQSDTDQSDGDQPAADVSRETSSSAADRLEREGDVAADYLEKLLDVADLDGDIDVDIDGDRAAVAIVDSEEGRVPRRLVGRDGEVLEALQELTRLAVLAQTGERSRLMLDVAGHRAARRQALVARAGEAVEQVKSSDEPLSLEPMSPFERKVVHDAVAALGLQTESEGVEPHRHVVVLPS